MITMEATDYREAHIQLRADTRPYCSPVRDMVKYIDKMTMIGRKYGQLERSIRDNLSCGEQSHDLQEIFETEFSALEYMIAATVHRLESNRMIHESVEEDLMDLQSDFRLVRLAVKAKAMGAKAEMQEFTARVDRQEALVLVK